MDGIGTTLARNPNNAGDIQIGGDGFGAMTNEIAFVGLETVQCKTVFVSVNRDCGNPHFHRRTHDADRDFATVGDQEFAYGHVVPACLKCCYTYIIRTETIPWEQ